MKKPVISVVGSYAVGMTMRVGRIPTNGETLIGHSFKQLHGGKGSNQAIGCARMGASVKFISCIGMDAYGEKVLSLYKEEGVDYSHSKFSKSLLTGVGFIIVDDNGNNIITLDPGANNELTPSYIEETKDVIANSNVLLMQLEIPVETVYAAARIAKENGVKVVLNPAPYKRLPEEIWQYVDIVTPNEKEAKLILGYAPDKEVSIEKLAEELIEKGVENVIITLGGRGSFFRCRIKDADIGLTPSKKVDVVDTTGAGDTFNAALGVAIAEGAELKKAISFATTAASLSVMKYGVIESIPYRDEIDNKLSN